MLRGLTGTPMRMIAFANSVLAEAEPEPFTLANLTTKSLTASMLFVIHGRLRPPCAGRRCFAASRPGVRHLDEGLLHVPRPGRAALRAQAAVQADVLVLGHDPSGLEPGAHVEVLRGVARGGAEARAHLGLLAVGGEGDAVHRADVHAGVALDAQLRREHRLHVAVEAALRLLPGELAGRSPSSTSWRMSFSAMLSSLSGTRFLASGTIVVVVAPLVDAHLLRHQVHERRRAHRHVLALAEPVDRDGGVVAVGHGPDDVLRARARRRRRRTPSAGVDCSVAGSSTGMPHLSNSTPMSRSIQGRRSPARPPPAPRRTRSAAPVRRWARGSAGPCRRTRPAPSRRSCR